MRARSMKSRCLICSFSLCSLIIPPQNKMFSRVKYSFPGGVLLVTFNKALTSKVQLDNWIRLSPTLSAYNHLLVPLDLRQCIPDDKRYVNCASTGKLDLRNVEVNVSGIIDLERSLDPFNYPEGLRGVVSYFKQIQAFALWRARRQRDALTRHNLAPLRETYDDLSSDKICNVMLEHSSLSKGEESFINLVLVDWGNCVWKLEKDKIGAYPYKQWGQFLKFQKITEKVAEETPED
jgi:hypothetical protein